MAKAPKNAAEMVGQRAYVARAPIRHDGVFYGPGDELTLSDDDAAALGGKVTAMPPSAAPPAPETPPTA